MNLLFALVLALNTFVGPAFGTPQWVDWYLPNGTTSAVRTYTIHGGYFNVVVEGNNNFSQDKTRAILSGAGFRYGTVNFVPVDPCWSVTIASDDRTLERVWIAEACNRVFMPWVGNQKQIPRDFTN